MNKEWLEHHHNQGLSQRQIAQLANVSAATIRSWFKKYSIKPRSISDALKINPSKSIWDDERRDKFSKKMIEVQSHRADELSKSSRKNWSLNRSSIVDGIKRSAASRRSCIDTELLISLICKTSLRKMSEELGYSISTIRNNIRSKLGIHNLAEYKKFKVNINTLVELYQSKTQQLCGDQLGVSATTISRMLKSYNIDTSIHFGQAFKDRISSIVEERWKNDDYRHKMAIARSETNKISSIQIKLYELLDKMGLNYEKEFVVGPYTFDCKVGDYLIECNGDYWHSLNTVLSNDQNKLHYIIKYHPSYKVRAIWEHEFSDLKKLEYLINYWLGKKHNRRQISLADISVEIVESSSLKEFYGAYHYLSNCPRGGIAIAGKYNEETVVAALYSTLVRQNLPFTYSSTLELSRFCIHPRFHHENLGSWFLSKSIKLLPRHITTIISYSDLTHNHTGGLYKASNFKINHIVKPDYWYVKENGWVLHKKTVYNRAKLEGLKENEYARRENLKKVKGKEKICFRYDK